VADRLRIALAQLNPKVGDLKGNLALAKAALERAEAAKADILMLSELFLTGYFPEDLFFKPRFIEDALAAAAELVRATRQTGVSLLLPTIWREGHHLYNAILLAEHGKVVSRRYKRELPNDDVFYEKRYFTPGPLPEPVEIKGVSIGLPVCEDIWHRDVPEYLAGQGAELLLCPNGSPYWANKQRTRRELIRARIHENGLPVLYLNQVGGQDELVFDGASFGMEPGNKIVFQAKSFEADFSVSDWERTKAGWRCAKGEVIPLASTDEAPWQAMLRGLRDYVRKNGFKKVVLGLSGGIDSAIVATIAADALGPENVHAVMLPYRYTSEDSLTDANDCAQRLGIRYDIVSIGKPVDEALSELQPVFGNVPVDLTEENIQSRMRGLVLMAVSNKTGAMLLTTGNKSEMAVGYATIYGDMNGGFNPIKDLYKTEVFRLSSLRNSWKPLGALGPSGEVIPPNIITRPPTAELRENQTDQDSLPPYDVLDAILERLVEREETLASIVADGFDREVVARIDRLLNIAEYKRRQAAPGVKVTSRNFGRDRRYPITNRFRDSGKTLPEPDEELLMRGSRGSAEAFDG
jgi:NAD+ synthase